MAQFFFSSLTLSLFFCRVKQDQSQMSSTLSLSRCLTRSLAAQELFCQFCCSATVPLKILSNSVCDVAGTMCSSAVFFLADKCPIHSCFLHETLKQSQSELLVASSSCRSGCGF